MIEVLKLTMSGDELRTLLEQGMRRHEDQANRWTHETLRTTDDESEEAPLLPQHMCEHEAERHAWHASVLAFIRDHVVAGETYRLSAADLEYGELLPEKTGSVEQVEYEERTRVGFNLERLVKSVDRLIGTIAAVQSRTASIRHEYGDTRETVIDETDEFRTTHVELEDEPEIMKVERK